MSIKAKLSGDTKELYTERYYNKEVYPEEEKLRKVKRNFYVSNIGVDTIVDDSMAMNMLQKERETLYLKIMFIGLLLCIYSFI